MPISKADISQLNLTHGTKKTEKWEKSINGLLCSEVSTNSPRTNRTIYSFGTISGEKNTAGLFEVPGKMILFSTTFK